MKREIVYIEYKLNINLSTIISLNSQRREKTQELLNTISNLKEKLEKSHFSNKELLLRLQYHISMLS